MHLETEYLRDLSGSNRYEVLGFRSAISCLIRADNDLSEEPENNRAIKPLLDAKAYRLDSNSVTFAVET